MIEKEYFLKYVWRNECKKAERVEKKGSKEKFELVEEDGKRWKKMERDGERWREMEEDGERWRKMERDGGR